MTGRHRVTPAERREKRAAVDDPEVVMEAAAAFIAVRPRSVGETRRRLRHHGYQPALVDQVIERFAQLGYLDDDAFARAWVDSRDRARPRGENALRRELALKGVARETVDLVLADRAGSTAPHTATNMDPDAQLAGGADHAAARRLVDRRRAAIAREPDPRRRRQKVYALLARNGFDPEVCRDVSAALSEEA